MSEHFPKSSQVDIMLFSEGTYPYVKGGVSSWLLQLMQGLPEFTFGVCFIGATPYVNGKKMEVCYEFPPNLKHLEVHYLFDKDATNTTPSKRKGNKEGFKAIRKLHLSLTTQRGQLPEMLQNIDFYFQDVPFEDFLYSQEAWKFINELYMKNAPDIPFIDYFLTVRNIHKPIWILAKIVKGLPSAKIFHSPSTGYAGFLGALSSYTTKRPFILTEHGIYTRERKIDMLSADWIEYKKPTLLQQPEEYNYIKKMWVEFFDKIGLFCYYRANHILSLYRGAQKIQIALGAPEARCDIIPNGVDVARLMQTITLRKDPPKPIITLIGRVVPISVVKFHYLGGSKVFKKVGQFLSKKQQTIQKIDKEKHSLRNEANYWLIKAQLYAHFKERKKARYALHEALRLNQHNLQISFTAIDLFLRYGFATDAKATLQDIVQNSSMSSSLYLAVASLYYTLHDIDAAAFYTDKLQRTNSSLTQTIEYRFLRRDIYKAQSNQTAALRETRAVQSLLRQEAEKNPLSLKSDKYLYDYLRVSMETLQADSFEHKLLNAKAYLSKAHYDDLQYAWAIKNNADEKAHAIYLQTKSKELWLEFSNALMQQEHSKIEDMLFSYLSTLPLDDASYAAHNDGQIALGQSLTYESLATNSKNKNAYISWRDLVKKRSDLFDAKLSYYNRDPLLRKYITVNNDTYINDGYSLLSHIAYYKNSTLDNTILVYTPNNSYGIDFGLKKHFNKAKIELKGGYAESMDSYYRFSLYAEYTLNSYFTLKAKAAKNITADESTQLLIGGKKDMISLGLLYQIQNRIAFTCSQVYSKHLIYFIDLL